MIRRTTTHDSARAVRPRLRAWMMAGVAALAIAACNDVLIPLPGEGPPDAMEFTMGGYMVSVFSLEVRGDTVVLQRSSGDLPAFRTVRVVPTVQAWRDFWSAAERAGVRRWARRYANEDVVDGAGWGLRIENGGRVLESEGSNAYPDRNGREHEEVTPDFQLFVDAVGELVGEW